MRCDRNQSTSARMSRLKPPNLRVSFDTVPSSCSSRMVATCSIRCTSIPATRLWIGSTEALLWLYSTVREASGGLARSACTRKRDKPIYHACFKLCLSDNLGYGLAKLGPVITDFHHWGRPRRRGGGHDGYNESGCGGPQH